MKKQSKRMGSSMGVGEKLAITGRRCLLGSVPMLLIACGSSQPAAAPVLPPGVVLVGDSAPAREVVPPPMVRVNQLGYLPAAHKLAYCESSAAAPLTATVVDESGKELWSGKTQPTGKDPASGQSLHRIDFSALTVEGKGYRVVVAGQKSAPFALAADLYAQLKNDSLWYFYHTRSGLEIALPFAGETQWVRPAGHLSDSKVPCAKDAGCDYTLDVSGGWYDAGDQGKYVVNGGIATWTLLNLHEFFQATHPDWLGAYADGKLRMPEAGNGISDLLDEARWEVEFLLKMQVPEGKPHAGMAHHKIHDAKWTSLGTKPPTDTAEIKMERFLRPVSTAATLNLAATAAQAARVWKQIDPAFSQKCLKAAKAAYAAAEANPKLFAKKADVQGGGPYDDDHVADEFYWAAAELYATTGEATWKEKIQSSPYYLAIGMSAAGNEQTPMNWRETQVLGTLSLLVAPKALSDAERGKVTAQISKVADGYLKTAAGQGFPVPLRPVPGDYIWGSNSSVLNNALILCLAHQYTGKKEYLQGAQEAMTYLLGANALGQSYITGYGERSTINVHHRFWAYGVNPEVFPKPIPGLVAGGPNAHKEDPVMAHQPESAVQAAYIDDAQAYSVNEVTINWNAPLAWVTGYLDSVR